MKNRLATVLLVLACTLAVATAFAADKWTPQQKEVWQVEETFWSLMAKNDVEGMFGNIHPDYVGWSYEEPVPSDKEISRKWMSYMSTARDIVLYDLRPLAIQVYGNFAFVDYHYFMVTKDKKGEDKDHSGRWTDIFMKQDGKWLLIGDHGGSMPKDD